jgi:hypothetical protein
MSRVTLWNQTSRDFSNLRVKVYTGETILLGQRTEIVGTTHVLQFTPEFAAQLATPQGQQPTPAQFQIYNHSREYLVPVFNRGQSVVMSYLATVPPNADGPAVWLDMLHEGARVKYRPPVPQIHGVPTKVAAAVGLAAVIVLAGTTAFLSNSPWIVAAVCTAAGLFAQSVGAGLFRAVMFIKSLVLH